MAGWTLEEVLRATGGRPAAPGEAASSFTDVSTDTRDMRAGALFVPLRGERFDGHDYAAAALEAGAAAVLWARPEFPAALPASRLLLVADTLEAYQALGRAHRRRLGVPVVAVTGSVGKTTTKDLLSAILGSCMRVHKSRLNFNNEVGVPRTLLELDRDCEVAVLELAMRGPGQIRQLARLVDARVGLITAIGESHFEFLGSREAIADAKGELLEELPPEATAVLPAESPFFARLAGRAPGKVVSFAVDGAADWSVALREGRGLEGCDVEVRHPRGRSRLRFPLPGRHNLSNLMASLAAAAEFGVSPGDAAEAVASFHPTGLRSEVLRLAGGTLVLNDSYNAAPLSMASALEVLSEVSGRRVAVLGDMLELGGLEEQGHRDVGLAAARAGVDVLVAVGERSRALAEAAGEAGLARVLWAPDRDGAWEMVRREVHPGDVVLVKASRGIGLDALVERLRRESSP